MTGGWRHRCYRFLFWCVCCWCGLGGVVASPILDTAQTGLPLAVDAYVDVLEDPQHRFSLPSLPEPVAWQALLKAGLNQGLSASSWWLRLRVSNTSDQTLTRWWVFGSPRLEHLDFYRTDAQGRVSPVVHSGLAFAQAERPVAGLSPIFPVVLAPGETTTLWVRVHSRSRLLLDSTWWDPVSYRVHEADLTVSQWLPAGMLVVVAACLAIHAALRRNPPLAWLAAWLCAMAMNELSFSGHLYRWLWVQGGEVPVRATLSLSLLSLVLAVCFSAHFLRLHRDPVWRWVYTALSVAGAVAMAEATLGDLRLATRASTVLLLGFYVLSPFALLAAWRRGVANLGLYFAALQVVWLAVLLRLLEQYGWLQRGQLPFEALTSAALLGLVLVVLFGVIRHAYLQQHAHQRAQAEWQRVEQVKRLQLAEQVRERTQSLQQAVLAADEAHQERSDLLLRVNQELGWPLADLLQGADRLLREPEPVAETGRVVRRSALHLQALIADLSQAHPQADAAPVPPTMPWVDAPRLFEELEAEARALVDVRGNRFAWQAPEHWPPFVAIDPKRLRQVVLNLVDNAAKFTQHGRVELAWQIEWAGETLRLLVRVSDTGVGMSPAQLGRVFEPYQRAQAARKVPGLGLGLTIARHWAEAMGGQISAQSVVGQGTVMSLALSLAWCARPPESPPGQAESTGRSPSEPPPACPPADWVLRVEEWARLGAVSDVLDEMERLVQQAPECRWFAQRVSELAQQGQFRALLAWLNENATPCPPSGAAADKPAPAKPVP